MILEGNVFPDVRVNLDISRLKTRRKENQYLIIKCTVLIVAAAIVAESRYLQTLDPYKVMWDLQAGLCGKIPEWSNSRNVKERKSVAPKPSFWRQTKRKFFPPLQRFNFPAPPLPTNDLSYLCGGQLLRRFILRPSPRNVCDIRSGLPYRYSSPPKIKNAITVAQKRKQRLVPFCTALW